MLMQDSCRDKYPPQSTHHPLSDPQDINFSDIEPHQPRFCDETQRIVQVIDKLLRPSVPN